MAPLYGTKNPVLPVHTTGRGAMEAAICNLFSAGDEIGVCCNGKFGLMWAGFAESYGLVVHRLATDWARNIEVSEIAAFLDDHPRARAITIPFGETSSGARGDIEAVCRHVRGRDSDTLVLVDAVSSLGGMAFEFDNWGVDFAATASQKCLMSSPGLAFAVLSDRAWAASARARLPRNYWNFADIRTETTKAKPETPGTPPVHLVMQVAEALRMIHEEGLENVFKRHEAMAIRCPRAGGHAWPHAPVSGVDAPLEHRHRDRSARRDRAQGDSRRTESARNSYRRRDGALRRIGVSHRTHG